MTIWKESKIAQLTHNWRKYTSAGSHREFEKSAMQNQKGAYAGTESALKAESTLKAESALKVFVVDLPFYKTVNI